MSSQDVKVATADWNRQHEAIEHDRKRTEEIEAGMSPEGVQAFQENHIWMWIPWRVYFLLTGEHPHRLPVYLDDGAIVGLTIGKAFKLKSRWMTQQHGPENGSESSYGRELLLLIELEKVRDGQTAARNRFKNLQSQEYEKFGLECRRLADLNRCEEDFLLRIKEEKSVQRDWEEQHDYNFGLELKLRKAIAQQSGLDDEDFNDGWEVEMPRFISRQPASGLVCPSCNGTTLVYKSSTWRAHWREGGPVVSHIRAGTFVDAYDRKGCNVAKHNRMVWRICPHCITTFKRGELVAAD